MTVSVIPKLRVGKETPPRLKHRIVRRARLGAPMREAMWRLFSSYYVGTTREVFERDLDEKDWVILLSDRQTSELGGFSTAQIYRRTLAGRAVVVLFSGDTILERGYWGQGALQWGFLELMIRVRLRYPLLPAYWLLTTKGYKTYLLLTRYFPEHWPRHERPTPAWPTEVIDTLAREKFGARYDASRGIVRATAEGCRLREDVAPISEREQAQPDIRFFVELNPGHTTGDELCCLGRIETGVGTTFLTKQGRRFVRSLSPRSRAS